MQPGNVCITVAALFVVTFSGLLCQDQQAPPPCRGNDSVNGNSSCCTCSTNMNGNNVTLCKNQCPDGYYVATHSGEADPDCYPSTTTTSAPTTTTSTPTPTLSPPDQSTVTTTNAPTTTVARGNGGASSDNNNSAIHINRTITCIPCDATCANCSGGGPANCTSCKDGHALNSTTKECQNMTSNTQDRGNDNIAIIAGASAAGGAVLVAVVVTLVVCCVRRRRQRGNTDVDTDSDPGIRRTPPPEVNREEKAMGESVIRGEVGQTYENIPKVPRPLSIERSHDKVTRYVRDPTVKRNDSDGSGLLPHSPTEERELQELPVAPTAPTGTPHKPSSQPPAEQYEVVEAPGPSNQGIHSHPQPKRAATSKPPGHRHHHGGGRGLRRKTQPEDLPNPAAPFSLPNLPSQVRDYKVEGRKVLAEAPEEDYVNMEGLKVKAGDESDKEDYENAPALKSEQKSFHAALAPPADGDDDTEDYENLGQKGSLLPHAHKKKDQPHGEVNAGAVLDDDPQEVYGNQDAIVEDAHRHQHGHQHVSEDDDQPLYTNDDTESPYQNIHFGLQT